MADAADRHLSKVNYPPMLKPPALHHRKKVQGLGKHEKVLNTVQKKLAAKMGKGRCILLQNEASKNATTNLLFCIIHSRKATVASTLPPIAF